MLSSSASWVALKRGTHLHPFYNVGNQAHQGAKWKVSSLNRNKSQEPDMFFSSCIGGGFEGLVRCGVIASAFKSTIKPIAFIIISFCTSYRFIDVTRIAFIQQSLMYFGGLFLHNLPMKEKKCRDIKSGRTWVMPSLTLRSWFSSLMNQLLHERS